MVQSFQMTMSWMSSSIHFDQAVLLERGEASIRVMTHTAFPTVMAHSRLDPFIIAVSLSRLLRMQFPSYIIHLATNRIIQNSQTDSVREKHSRTNNMGTVEACRALSQFESLTANSVGRRFDVRGGGSPYVTDEDNYGMTLTSRAQAPLKAGSCKHNQQTV